MNTGKKLPMGALFMILILALAFVGVGYGLWSKTLEIKGTVRTGYVDATLSLEDIWENDHGKDVGSCDAELHDTDGKPETFERLLITIGNAYPSYECSVLFDVTSTGSVPVHIYQPLFTLKPPAAEVTIELRDCYRDDTQLHEGDSAYCTMYFHVEQPAEQNAVYTFVAVVEARQFNEPRP